MRSPNYISIIIPALNEERYIGMCLASIKNMDVSRDSYEVILSDNGSTDKTHAIAESFKESINIRIIVTPGVKVAELRNIGVRASRGDVLAFVDADCTVDRNWLNNAVKYFSDESVAAVGYGHEIPPECTWVEKAWDLNKKRKPGPTKTLPSGNMIVRRTSFLEIGGFDSTLTSNEDFDLCHKLLGKGLKILSDPDIRAVHWGFPKSLASFYKRELWHGANVLRIFFANIREMRNFKAASFALYYILAIIYVLAGAAAFLLFTTPLHLAISISAMLAPPLFLTLRTLRGKRLSSKYFFQLFLLYFIYGIARAVSVFQFK